MTIIVSIAIAAIYFAIGLIIMVIVDDHPDHRSILPILLWPIVLITASLLFLIYLVKKLSKA